ncbi:hypothetical protein PIB30_074054 [Stylosanthes scabra]|uniref:Uncharacterized protein n=1 Tax=Stylosanthes scabra TaxID=79078 RepID=A0ABU6XPJ8_9FABA|nr:hypothetical protein [Stylosanthes scabra]
MDNVSGGGSFLVLVHHNGKIKRRTREGVKFKSECPTNVFIMETTSFVDLQASIIRKLDEDLQVLLHCHQQYPEVRTIELYIEIEDVGASSGGSTPLPPPVHVRCTHAPLPVCVPKTERVASPSFDVSLPRDDYDTCDLGDNRSIGELAVAMARTPQSPSPHIICGSLS